MVYKTKGTCSREIHIEVENDIIKDVAFIGGCNGNTQGIASLAKMEGIDCGGRGTSCPDQLAKALKNFVTAQ